MEQPPKYPSTPHWPDSQSVHRDDSYHVDPEYFVGKNVVITEKLDGGCTTLYNGEVYARSNVAPSHAGWMGMVRKHHAYKTLIDCGSPRFYYGEDLYGIHSIEYDEMIENETFRLFAIRHGDKFLSWENVEAEAKILQVPTVPVQAKCIGYNSDFYTRNFEYNIQNPSALGGECEGFVMRIADEFSADEFSMNVVKYVRANHVQTDQHWRKNWKQCKIKERMK